MLIYQKNTCDYFKILKKKETGASLNKKVRFAPKNSTLNYGL